MNLNIISIIQSCNTLHELKEEFKKPFGWFRFISKNKAKKLEDKAGKLRNEAIVKRNKSVKDFTSKK